MKKLFVIFLATCLISTSHLSAGDAKRSPQEILFHNTSRAEFRLALDNHLEEVSAERFEMNAVENMPGNRHKSVGKAVLFSAVVPGSGQAYGGSWLKGAIFFAVEVGTIAGYVHFDNRGNELEDRYEMDADQLWNEDAYWDWISVVSGINRQSMQALRDYEHETFSHFLPEERNQQYYENIGKYNQFVVGWEDFRNTLGDVSDLTFDDYLDGSYSGQDLTTISSQRNAYVRLRRESNDNFNRATNMVTITLLNHVLSAIDAGLTIKRGNEKLLETQIRLDGRYYNHDIIPTVNLGVTW